MDVRPESVILDYTIHKFSSYSGSYAPDNIMVNKPMDQLSRWFTDSSTQTQYIMLKLKTPSIVESIQFGKFFKAHVSNLKKFQVFGGTEESSLYLLLSGGLKNDSTAEVFRLRHKTQEGLYLPVTFIQIVPLQSWGPAYNYTVWYVELKGKNQDEFICNALETINLRKEEEAVRLLLKHLRRRRYKDAFEALVRETGVQLEGAMQAKLWNALVENGDYKLAEKIFTDAAANGELDWFMSWQPYTPEWRLMSACSSAVEARLWSSAVEPAHPALFEDLHSADRDVRVDLEGPVNDGNFEIPEPAEAACGPSGCCGKPGPRGGHQLVVDSTTGTLYLFGGWNGVEDLDDLWSYCTSEEQWTLLCRHSKQAGGPAPRSCHKMVFDPQDRRLYTLGRYLDNAQRVPANMNSDLYAYDVAVGYWSLVCENTAEVGGPRLVFDHQMCIDADTQTIYVFGGRVLPTNSEEGGSPQYSGLYAYYIKTNSWQLLLPDKHSLNAPQPRVSHSMLFHPVSRRLYIFAGQRNKEHLVDLWWWDVGTGTCAALCDAGSAPPPAPGFTQRATIDPDTDELHVLSALTPPREMSTREQRNLDIHRLIDMDPAERMLHLVKLAKGMSKEKDKRVYNTLWVFSLRRLSWTCVYRNESFAPNEPRPRFAHQLVYDPVKKIHYLFGGNPGKPSSPRLRLDDLWSLRLERVALHVVIHDARATIREACFRALCVEPKDQMAALEYLRGELKEVMDHSDPNQVERFQKLATVLFSGEARAWDSACVSLTPARARALASRRAAARSAVHLAHALAMVLGAEESTPEDSQPYEDIPAPEPETWEVGRDEDGAGAGPEGRARQHRIQLYEQLAAYCRPSTVPPAGDVMDLVLL